ncbi:MAG: YkgJ family cysteine cluster protein [Clostridiales bacterium]|jgi:Fe-S-cluster containining protein|nr:YkgJ family cysteine cluster protein [Clostridiales bacterium]
MVKPTEVKNKAQQIAEQNYKFRAFLKSCTHDDKLDAQFLELHEGLFADYDCCKCNNCCKSYNIILDSGEVKRLSEFIGLAEGVFAAEYLIDADPEDEKPFKFKANPCAFLNDDGRCLIQNCKPEVCTGFPYTDQPHRLSRMYSVIEHAEVCPVVYEILERLKVMYRFRK